MLCDEDEFYRQIACDSIGDRNYYTGDRCKIWQNSKPALSSFSAKPHGP